MKINNIKELHKWLNNLLKEKYINKADIKQILNDFDWNNESNQVEAQVIKPTRNNGFCGDCYFFELYGGEYDLTARCKLLKVEELKFNDWFIAECNNDEAL